MKHHDRGYRRRSVDSVSAALWGPAVAVGEVQPLRWRLTVGRRVVVVQKCRSHCGRTAARDVCRRSWRHKAAVPWCVTVTCHPSLAERTAARRWVNAAAATDEIQPDAWTTHTLGRHRRLGLVFDVRRRRVQASKRTGN